MALYDPIRDGFREFNRMLQDAQTFDDRNAQAQSERAYRHTVLESNLVQQEFENQMAKQRHVLAMNGDVRAERDLTLRIKSQKDNLEIRNKELALSTASGERDASRLKMNQEKHADEITILGAQAEEATRPYTPVDTDLNGLVSERNSLDTDYMGELNEVAGQMGAFVDSDLLLKRMDVDEGGQLTGGSSIVQLSPEQQKKLAPIIMGLNAKYNDPNAMVKVRITELDDQRKKMVAQAAKTANYSLADKAFAKREINRIKGEMKNEFANFKNESVEVVERRRAQEMTALAAWQRNAGLTEQATATDRMAQASHERSIAAGGTKGNNMVQKYKKKLSKDGRAVGAGKATFNTVDNTYAYPDSEGNIVESTLLPEDETLVKPSELTDAERGLGGGGVKGLLTEKDMTRVKDLYEVEGMTAVFASDAVKPKLSSMRTIIKRVHKQLGGKPEDRQTAKIETVQKIEELELAYWDKADPIRTMNKRDSQAALRALGIERVKGRTPQEQLTSYYYRKFEDAIRKVAADPKMRVYRPNETTRKMSQGVTR